MVDGTPSPAGARQEAVRRDPPQIASRGSDSAASARSTRADQRFDDRVS